MDTTYDVTIGVLNDSYGWDHFERFQEKRASSTLQTETHRILQKLKINPRELKGIITIAGPGFYTGLRLSEGFADVLKFFGIPHYSFYSYEVPRWVGESEGVWMTKAYRGEYFFCQWKGDENHISLIETKNVEAHLATLGQVTIHSQTALDEKTLAFLNHPKNTVDLIEKNPMPIMSKVLDLKLKRDSYYFRAPEDEFRVST